MSFHSFTALIRPVWGTTPNTIGTDSPTALGTCFLVLVPLLFKTSYSAALLKRKPGDYTPDGSRVAEAPMEWPSAKNKHHRLGESVPMLTVKLNNTNCRVHVVCLILRLHATKLDILDSN